MPHGRLLKVKSGNSIIRETSDFTNEETAYYNFSLQPPTCVIIFLTVDRMIHYCFHPKLNFELHLMTPSSKELQKTQKFPS